MFQAIQGLVVFCLISFSLASAQSNGLANPGQQPLGWKSHEIQVLNSSFAVADLNHDGFNEIIIVAGVGDCGVGTALSSFENPFEPICGENALSSEEGAQREISNGGECGLYVHVLDGTRNDLVEFNRNWPRLIQTKDSGFHPTVAIGDINFDGELDVLVGGEITGGTLTNAVTNSVFAFQADGSDVPGWEDVDATEPPFYNAPAFGDINLDGAPESLFADESTFMHRFNSLGRRRQCQYLGDVVNPTPTIGDIGRLGTKLADGIPDEIGSATDGSLRAFASFGKNQECYGQQDMLLDFASSGVDGYFSSIALFDFDQDGTLDLATTRRKSYDAIELRVFCSTQGVSTYSVNAYSPIGSVMPVGYSSVALGDINADQQMDLCFGSNDGRLIALTYDRTRAAGQRILKIWSTEGVVLDGWPLTSSPILANLTGDLRPEIAIGSESGSVFVVSPQGSVLKTLSCLDDKPFDTDAAIVGSVAVSSRFSGDFPMIVAGNRRGVFRFILDDYPAFNPSQAPWPTFHGNNARTGCNAAYLKTPTRGSIGGIAHTCEIDAEIALLNSSGQQVQDYYGGPAIAGLVSDRRFLFEMLPPGDYIVRLLLDPVIEMPVSVSAGQMSFVTLSCPLASLEPSPR